MSPKYVSEEIQQQLDRLKQGGEERDDAIYSITESADPEAITAMLEFLDELNSPFNESESYTAVYALLGNLERTLPAILSYLERSPLSTMGADCAYILGDIAGLGRRKPDPRIVPALAKAGEIALHEKGISSLRWSDPLPMVIYALRQCLYYGTALDAQLFLISVLHQLIEVQGGDFEGWNALQLLETLYANDKDYLLPKLNEVLSNIPADCEFAETINEFLAGKRTGDQYW